MGNGKSSPAQLTELTKYAIYYLTNTDNFCKSVAPRRPSRPAGPPSEGSPFPGVFSLFDWPAGTNSRRPFLPRGLMNAADRYAEHLGDDQPKAIVAGFLWIYGLAVAALLALIVASPVIVAVVL